MIQCMLRNMIKYYIAANVVYKILNDISTKVQLKNTKRQACTLYKLNYIAIIYVQGSTHRKKEVGGTINTEYFELISFFIFFCRLFVF